MPIKLSPFVGRGQLPGDEVAFDRISEAFKDSNLGDAELVGRKKRSSRVDPEQSRKFALHVELLKKCKKHLNKGDRNLGVCAALELAAADIMNDSKRSVTNDMMFDAVDYLHAWIRDQISGRYIFMWLHFECGIPLTELTHKKVFDYRRQWVDNMILQLYSDH